MICKGDAPGPEPPWLLRVRAARPRRPGRGHRHLAPRVCHTDLHRSQRLRPVALSWSPATRSWEGGGGRRRGQELKPGDPAAVGCLVDSCRSAPRVGAALGSTARTAVLTYSGYEKDRRRSPRAALHEIVVDERSSEGVPEMAPEKVAPLLCAGITTFSPLRRVQVGKGAEVAVVAGRLGHMGVKFAAAFEAEVTVAASAQEGRRSSPGPDFVLTATRATGQARRRLLPRDPGRCPRPGTQRRRDVEDRGPGLRGAAADRSDPAFSLVFRAKAVAGSLIGGLPETRRCSTCALRASARRRGDTGPEIDESYAHAEERREVQFVIDTSSLRWAGMKSATFFSVRGFAPRAGAASWARLRPVPVLPSQVRRAWLRWWRRRGQPRCANAPASAVTGAPVAAPRPLRWRMEPEGRLTVWPGESEEGRCLHLGLRRPSTGYLSFRLTGVGRGVGAPSASASPSASPDGCGRAVHYKGGLSSAWLPDEIVNVDFLPQDVRLPRSTRSAS
jgi:uncharacterized zinc-type alcohol dehydrogenase-like protein